MSDCKCINRERQKDGTFKVTPCACESQRKSGTPLSQAEIDREIARVAKIGAEIAEYGKPVAAKAGTRTVLVRVGK